MVPHRLSCFHDNGHLIRVPYGRDIPGHASSFFGTDTSTYFAKTNCFALMGSMLVMCVHTRFNPIFIFMSTLSNPVLKFMEPLKKVTRHPKLQFYPGVPKLSIGPAL